MYRNTETYILDRKAARSTIGHMLRLGVEQDGYNTENVEKYFGEYGQMNYRSERAVKVNAPRIKVKRKEDMTKN